MIQSRGVSAQRSRSLDHDPAFAFGWRFAMALLACSALSVVVTSQIQSAEVRADSADRPNFIIIFTDDQGYGDLGCFGSETIKTPNIDRLAAEGRKYTSFYSACSVCSPSRTALLTGCYPKRVGMHKHVLFPTSLYGLNPDEVTIADHLKAKGYATACVGKWHLGHHKETLPTSNGFDSYYGIPYSNDMNHPDNKNKPAGPQDALWADPESCLTRWNTPLMENEAIIELPVDQRTITRRYTDRAIEFVTEHQHEPFFLYLPHSMPHIPLYVPEDAHDPDPRRAYQCVIEHIDAEVGRLADKLRELDLDKNTFLIYTSDNGPWLRFESFGGSAGPLRDGKGTTFEGGQRVPCVMWAPGRIPGGTTTNAFTSTMDLLPTIAALSGGDVPLDNAIAIDGVDISSTFDSDESPRNELVYYSAQGVLDGIRIGKWKYLEKQAVAKKTPPPEGKPPVTVQRFLFDLSEDLGESTNLVDEHPGVVARMKARMMEKDAEVTAGERSVWQKYPPHG